MPRYLFEDDNEDDIPSEETPAKPTENPPEQKPKKSVVIGTVLKPSQLLKPSTVLKPSKTPTIPINKSTLGQPKPSTTTKAAPISLNGTPQLPKPDEDVKKKKTPDEEAEDEEAKKKREKEKLLLEEEERKKQKKKKEKEEEEKKKKEAAEKKRLEDEEKKRKQQQKLEEEKERKKKEAAEKKRLEDEEKKRLEEEEEKKKEAAEKKRLEAEEKQRLEEEEKKRKDAEEKEKKRLEAEEREQKLEEEKEKRKKEAEEKEKKRLEGEETKRKQQQFEEEKEKRKKEAEEKEKKSLEGKNRARTKKTSKTTEELTATSDEGGEDKKSTPKKNKPKIIVSDSESDSSRGSRNIKKKPLASEYTKKNKSAKLEKSEDAEDKTVGRGKTKASDAPGPAKRKVVSDDEDDDEENEEDEEEEEDETDKPYRASDFLDDDMPEITAVKQHPKPAVAQDQSFKPRPSVTNVPREEEQPVTAPKKPTRAKTAKAEVYTVNPRDWGEYPTFNASLRWITATVDGKNYVLGVSENDVFKIIGGCKKPSNIGCSSSYKMYQVGKELYMNADDVLTILSHIISPPYRGYKDEQKTKDLIKCITELKTGFLEYLEKLQIPPQPPTKISVQSQPSLPAAPVPTVVATRNINVPNFNATKLLGVLVYLAQSGMLPDDDSEFTETLRRKVLSVLGGR